MLLLHQVGSVKIGEVVRYTLTYTPSQDRILPSPEKLHVRIRNTSAIALRAAFVHGPYTLSVSTYPSAFDPNEKFENPRRYGVPQFEPMLKAGGSWESELIVPDDIRQSAGAGNHGNFGKGPEHDEESATWVIEVSSQVIFSTSAAVGYEVIVARDHKSLNLGHSLPVVGDKSQVPSPGRISDHQQSVGAKDGHHPAQSKGVYSRAVKVKVEDTAALWNKPRLPGWDDKGLERINDKKPGADAPVESVVDEGGPQTQDESRPKKRKKVHLVVLTHGLHSNLGADMLFLKESIDNAVKQAKTDAAKRRKQERAKKREEEGLPPADAETLEREAEEEVEDEEEVIVRGFSGNATKTERGIKYLGKRLARFVLSMTYPDQPFMPIGKGVGEGVAHSIEHNPENKPSHKNSTIHEENHRALDLKNRPFEITSISFIAHSLGGLIQTYAVAYVQKHSPDFFDRIKPVNFIAMATPFLGLSNENPLYVKFALDFGLVGRTGKDLGLTWRAPTIARSGWGAIVGNLGETAHKKVYGETQPESKPLLRILPTGPAHTALKKFRNRTVYSNVINDGIVPLRTSCLLFLDWQGLGRVEKARRETGLVETMVGFGWAELTGSNTANARQKSLPVEEESKRRGSGATTPRGDDMLEVPQPASDAIYEDDRASVHSVPPTPFHDASTSESGETKENGPLSGFFSLFRRDDHSNTKDPANTAKQHKILRRGQTMPSDDGSATPTTTDSSTTDVTKTSKVTAGHELEDDANSLLAPPRTTFFESAGDLMNPKMPDVEYLINPSKRPRTIFHDRVYHPSDIPAPPVKKRSASSLMLRSRKTFGKGHSSGTKSSQSTSPSRPEADRNDSSADYDDTDHTKPDKHADEVIDSASMRVEEKIARGYHRDLSWRKVLVKLEPDAHNNIFVRRMFCNAYGWPVVKHLTDVHFSDSATARTRTEDEYLGERALDPNQPPDEHGGETKRDGRSRENLPATAETEEASEARDEVPALPKMQDSDMGSSTHSSQHQQQRPHPPEGPPSRVDSMAWSERDWIDSENESDLDVPSGVGALSPQSHKDDKAEKGEKDGRSSPVWNWAEKIVGKGATKDKDKDKDKPRDKDNGTEVAGKGNDELRREGL